MCQAAAYELWGLMELLPGHVAKVHPRNSERSFLFTVDLAMLNAKQKGDEENTWNLGIYLKKPKHVAFIFAEEIL